METRTLEIEPIRHGRKKICDGLVLAKNRRCPDWRVKAHRLGVYGKVNGCMAYGVTPHVRGATVYIPRNAFQVGDTLEISQRTHGQQTIQELKIEAIHANFLTAQVLKDKTKSTRRVKPKPVTEFVAPENPYENTFVEHVVSDSDTGVWREIVIAVFGANSAECDDFDLHRNAGNLAEMYDIVLQAEAMEAAMVEKELILADAPHEETIGEPVTAAHSDPPQPEPPVISHVRKPRGGMKRVIAQMLADGIIQPDAQHDVAPVVESVRVLTLRKAEMRQRRPVISPVVGKQQEEDIKTMIVDGLIDLDSPILR